MKKKLLSIVLALSMICALVPIMASAETTATSGTCGENVTWTLSDDGTLTISGTGIWRIIVMEIILHLSVIRA